MDHHPTTSSNTQQQSNSPTLLHQQPETEAPPQQQDAPPPISKRQAKKMKKMEKVLAHRKERRKQQRERKREKRHAGKASTKTNAEEEVPAAKRPRLAAAETGGAKKQRFYTMGESKCRITVAVDMAFDELMDARTTRKTVSQLAYCYSTNRRSPNPLQLYIVNVQGKAKEVFDANPSLKQWDAHILQTSLPHLWAPEDIVYLTADSENVLEKLEENKVYVIGGLLDHNHHKGICLKKAQENGFGHARLPIDNHFRLSGRKVLTINQVFEILVRYSQEPDWEKAFLHAIPKRKGIEALVEGTSSEPGVRWLEEDIEEVEDYGNEEYGETFVARD